VNDNPASSSSSQFPVSQQLNIMRVRTICLKEESMRMNKSQSENIASVSIYYAVIKCTTFYEKLYSVELIPRDSSGTNELELSTVVSTMPKSNTSACNVGQLYLNH
jgi:hypothetical protein